MRNKFNSKAGFVGWQKSPKAKREQFAALCRDGYSREAIAGKMNIEIDTIREYARERGIPLPHSEYAVVKDLPRPEKPASRAKVIWDELIVHKLRELWAQGLSASQIATRLGEGVTRNSVIGKVHRLGLQGRVAKGNPRPKPPSDKAARVTAQAEAERAAERKRQADDMAERARALEVKIAAEMAAEAEAARQAEALRISLEAAVAPEPEPAEVLEVSKFPEVFENRGITIHDLNLSTCRWPLGGRYELAERFCGEPPLPGRPYCLCHCKIAFQSARPWRTAAKPVDVGAIPGPTPLNRVFAVHTN